LFTYHRREDSLHVVNKDDVVHELRIKVGVIDGVDDAFDEISGDRIISTLNKEIVLMIKKVN
jgi:hypothetical protein